MKKYKKYEKRARELGVTHAKVIKADTVVTGRWVLMKCRYGCSGYGKRLTCPPNTPTPEETRDLISEYRYALLIHNDEDSEVEVSDVVPELETEIFWDGYHKAFGMGAGPCRLCDKCGRRCKYPAQARPSMESCGIDVFSTARAHGYPIEVLTSEDQDGNYYGLILIE